MAFLRARSVGNLDIPQGFQPTGGSQRVGTYLKDASAAAIYTGDVVILETDGGIAPATTAAPANIIGVAAETSPATTAKTDFLVYDDPQQLFVVQDDGDTTLMNEAMIGTNVDLITTAGTAGTFRSKHEIDASSGTGAPAITATPACKVVGLHPIEQRRFATAAAQPRLWVVKFNQHLLGSTNVGI